MHSSLSFFMTSIKKGRVEQLRMFVNIASADYFFFADDSESLLAYHRKGIHQCFLLVQWLELP